MRTKKREDMDEEEIAYLESPYTSEEMIEKYEEAKEALGRELSYEERIRFFKGEVFW